MGRKYKHHRYVNPECMQHSSCYTFLHDKNFWRPTWGSSTSITAICIHSVCNTHLVIPFCMTKNFGAQREAQVQASPLCSYRMYANHSSSTFLNHLRILPSQRASGKPLIFFQPLGFEKTKKTYYILPLPQTKHGYNNTNWLRSKDYRYHPLIKSS